MRLLLAIVAILALPSTAALAVDPPLDVSDLARLHASAPRDASGILPLAVGELAAIQPALPDRASAHPPALTPAQIATAATAGSAMLVVAGFALYSRLGRDELLSHERRDALHKLVQSEPGIALSDLARRTGLAWGTTVYHLDRLARAGFVTSEAQGARRRYFPVGSVRREDRAGLGALQDGPIRSLACLVNERPGATQGELAAVLGLSASAASKQVTKLESAGLVRRERAWKRVRLHPAPKLVELLSPRGAGLTF